MDYIHYGHTEFKPELLTGVENRSPFGDVKPHPITALWASPEDAGYFGWKEWCERECFKTWALDTFFKFRLSDEAKILKIDSEESMRLLQPFIRIHPALSEIEESDIKKIIAEQKRTGFGQMLRLDFEKMQNEGYDAMEIKISEYPPLYWFLYGWDVDSICVWNPKVIIMTGSSDEMIQHEIDMEVK